MAAPMSPLLTYSTTRLACVLVAAAGCGRSGLSLETSTSQAASDAQAMGEPDATFLDSGTAPDAGVDTSVPIDAPVEAEPAGCFGQGIVALSTGDVLPMDLALDSTSVTWIDNGPGASCDTPTGSVLRVPKSGGMPTTLASPELSPVAVAIDGTSAYWADGCGSGKIRATSLAGGAVRDLPTPPTTFFTNERFLGVSGPDLYFNDYAMITMPKDGSGPEQPLPGDSNSFVNSAAVDSTGAYWAALIGGTGGTYSLLSYLPAIGHVTTVDTPATGVGGPMALDDAWVYYLSGTTLARAPKSGGASTLLASRPGGVVALAVDDTSLYWAEGFGQNVTPILAMPKSGGAVSTVASGAVMVRRIAADDRCVYWVEAQYMSGRIMRGPK